MKPNTLDPFIVLPFSRLERERLRFVGGVIFDRKICAHGIIERFSFGKKII